MTKPTKVEIKKEIVQETRELVFLALYLVLFLNSLAIYRSIVLGENIFSVFHFGYNLVEALLLAKIILLGKMMHLGERFAEKSLFIPTLYKAVIFCFFVFVFSILEHFILGFIDGKKIEVVWNEFASQGINEIAGKLLIAFLVFILLFSFMEIIRVFGQEKVFNLFFRRNKS